MIVGRIVTMDEPAVAEARMNTEHFGDWYADREPGIVSDRLRVQG